MKLNDFVRSIDSPYPMGKVTKVNCKTVWVETGWFEEMWDIKELVLLKWNEKLSRWQDA